MNPVRFADNSQDTIEGLLVPYGGSFSGRDSYGTYASARTDFALDWFDERPLLYDHGRDEKIGPRPIGRITSVEVRSDGIWMQAQLDRKHEYIEDIKQLVKKKAVDLSSATMAHLMEIDERSGEWIRWPLVEGSLTPTASNLDARIETYSFRSALTETGFEDLAEAVGERAEIVRSDEDLRAVLKAKARDKLSDSAFAYIDSSGGRHLPINDADHVRNALSRFDQTIFESDSAKAAAKKKVLAAAKKFGIDVNEQSRSADVSADTRAGTIGLPDVDVERSFEDIRDDVTDLLNTSDSYSGWCVVATFPNYVIARSYSDDADDYWKVAFTLDANLEPVLGERSAMKQVYVPAEAERAISGPLTLDATQLQRRAATLAQRTKDLGERRSSEGRLLSTSALRAIKETIDALALVEQELCSMVERAEREASEAARAAYLATPEARHRRLELLKLQASLTVPPAYVGDNDARTIERNTAV